MAERRACAAAAAQWQYVIPQMNPDTALLLAAVVPFVTTLALWRRRWLALSLVAVATIVGGWVLLIYTMDVAATAEVKAIGERATRGASLPGDDPMYDGVGDRVAMLLGGWIPGVFAVVVAIILCLIVSFVFRTAVRRGHPAAG